MRISIARALKERRRIIGEMNTLRNRINQNNLVSKSIKIVDGKFDKPSKEELLAERKHNPKVLLDDWYKLRDKLISLKVALHNANCGIAEKLATISEYKTELQLVDTSSYNDDCSYVNADFVRLTDVVFDEAWNSNKADELRSKINAIQDEIDEYNATHYIEVEW